MTAGALASLARWAAELGVADVPRPVVEDAKDQVLSTLAAVHAGYTSDLGAPLERAFGGPGAGPARALPSGGSGPPAAAAFLMAAWSMVLDYDDVMLGGHTGHSSVLVPLACAYARGIAGSHVVAAQVAANEVAARINMVCAAGSTRGQMASHTHLVAAAVARGRVEHLPAAELAQAVAFALSFPGRALYPAFLGSDAKALCAAYPLRAGMEAVDAVRAGLRAADGALDGPHGFFADTGAETVLEFLGGLGQRWHTATNSFKLRPACGYLEAALEAAAELARRERLAPEAIESIDVYGSLFTVGMDAYSAPYVAGPDSPISTLTFSVPFTVASALLHGDLRPEHLRREHVADPRVWELAARVRVHHDPELTARALAAAIPLGAALERLPRARARAYLEKLLSQALGRGGGLRARRARARLARRIARNGGRTGPMDFRDAEKALGARIRVRTAGGDVFEAERAVPSCFAGGAERGASRERMREKLLAAAAPVVGLAAAAEAADLVARLETLDAGAIRRLVDLNCVEPRRAETPSPRRIHGGSG